MTRRDADELWDEWISWIGDEVAPPSIWHDIMSAIAARQIWDSLRIVQREAPREAQANATLIRFVASGYFSRQGMAVRRQVDLDHDVISLARLIDAVRRYPDVLSRDRYATRTAPLQSREDADDVFDRMVGVGAEHIDPNAPRADLAQLKTRTAKVRKWADNEVAHYNEGFGAFGAELTYRDLHEAVDIVIKLGVKYRELLLGSTMGTTISMTPWLGTLTVPWIPDRDPYRRVQAEITRIEQKRAAGRRLDDDE